VKRKYLSIHSPPRPLLSDSGSSAVGDMGRFLEAENVNRVGRSALGGLQVTARLYAPDEFDMILAGGSMKFVST